MYSGIIYIINNEIIINLVRIFSGGTLLDTQSETGGMLGAAMLSYPPPHVVLEWEEECWQAINSHAELPSPAALLCYSGQRGSLCEWRERDREAVSKHGWTLDYNKSGQDILRRYPARHTEWERRNVGGYPPPHVAQIVLLIKTHTQHSMTACHFVWGELFWEGGGGGGLRG